VLTASADASLRMGLRVVLEADGFAVVGEAADADAAVACVVAERPDVALIAVALPGGGLEATATIARRAPATRLVLLADEPSGPGLVAAVQAGAAGYLSSGVDQRRLAAVLTAVLAGEVALPRMHTAHLLEALRGRDAERSRVEARARAPLSDREWEVLRLLADGAATGEMARRLRISEVTVRRHVSSVLAKLDLPDRASAAALVRPRSRN
jgi:DNA-binding NarL/FixJ family response regulator